LPLHGLEARDRLAELPPLLRVGARGFVGALREPDRERGDADAAGVEDLQRVDETLSLLADQLRRRQPAVLEHDFAGVARAHPELVLFLAGAHSRRAVLEDERRDAAM